MRKLALWPDVVRFLSKIERKHAGQIALRIFGLLHDPTAGDVARLRGSDGLYRADVGEYRVVFRFTAEEVEVPLVGKRNDDEVYKELRGLGL